MLQDFVYLLINITKGIARENEIIMRVIRSPQAVAQQYLFFAERQASKNQYTTGTAANIKSVGIIGAGTMGAGIAINFLSAGIKTLLLEKEQKFLDAGEFLIFTILVLLY